MATHPHTLAPSTRHEEAPPTPLPLTLLLAAAGPLAAGACLTLRLEPADIPLGAASLAAVILGLAALMLPGLYISTAFTGVAPPARHVLRAALDALGATGLLLLGLSPALAFLVATTTSWGAAFTLGHLVVGLASLIGLRTLYTRLFTPERALKALPVYLIWALITLVMGWRLFFVAFDNIQIQ